MTKSQALAHTLTGSKGASPVLFLHGFMGASADWRPLIAALEPARRCLAVDLPGHGASLHRADYTLEATTEALCRVLDHHEMGPSTVVGYSMGGRLALLFALRHPGRCRGLVLESASPGLRTNAERAERERVDEERAERLAADLSGFLRNWYRMPLFESLARHGLVQPMIEARAENDPDELARALRGLSVSRQPNLWPRLDDLPCPALALTGALDEKYAPRIRRMANASSTLRAVVVPEAGHNVHAERPAAFLHEVQGFLAADRVHFCLDTKRN